MSLHEERGTDARGFRNERGAIRAYVLSPTVYVTVGSGHMEDAHAAFLEGYGLDRIRLARGKQIAVFHDWIEMTGYDSQTRQRMTAWVRERLHVYSEVHLAVKSKIVAMGVQVANIAFGGMMRAHSTRAALEFALDRRLKATEPPPGP